MRTLIRLARWSSNLLENMPIGVGAWCVLFMGIVLVRDLIEGFSGGIPLVHPVDFFLHYPLAFINPLLTLSILLSLGSGVRLESVTRLMLFMWSLVMIPPLADLALGAVGAAAAEAHIGYSPVFRGQYWEHFVHFFNPGRTFQGTTAGIRIECFVEVVLALAYVLLKRKSLRWGLVLGVITAFVVYVVSLGYFTWPFHIYNLHTPAHEASLEGVRLFIVDQGLVATSHFDRFSHGSGAMHGLLLAFLTSLWFTLYRPDRAWALVRECASGMALGAAMVGSGLALGVGHFVWPAGLVFEPTPIDWVFLAATLVAGVSAMVPAAVLRAGSSFRGEERTGILIAAVAVCLINGWMVSYAVFTVSLVVLSVSVMRVVAPFATDRLPAVGQAIRGIQILCLVIVGFAAFARGEAVQALPRGWVLAGMATAMLGAFHGAGRGPLARAAATGTWVEDWTGPMPGWNTLAARLLGGIRRLAGPLNRVLPWLALATPLPLWLGAGHRDELLVVSLTAAAAYGLLSWLGSWGRRVSPALLVGYGVVASVVLSRDVGGDDTVDPPRIRAETALGYRLLWGDHSELAVEQFERAVQLGARQLEPFRNAVAVRQQMGDEEAAVELARKAVERNPERPKAWRLLGDALTRAGDRHEAVSAYRYWDALEPESVEMARKGAVSAGLAGLTRDALHFMRRGIAALPEDPFFQNGETSTRLSLLGEDVPVEATGDLADPSEADPELRRVLALQREGDDPEAHRVARDAAAKWPDDPLSHYLAGITGLAVGASDVARTELDRFLALKPGFAPAYLARAQARSSQGDLAGAVGDVRRAIELDSRNADVPLALATQMFRAGRPADALSLLALLRRDWPSRAREQLLIQGIDAHMRRLEEANDRSGLESLPEMLAGAGVTDPTVLAHFGRAMANLGALDEAESVFRQALEGPSGDSRSGVQLGILLLRRGKPQEASDALRRAIELGAADSPRVYSLLAKAYEAQGRSDLAGAARRREVELRAQEGARP